LSLLGVGIAALVTAGCSTPDGRFKSAVGFDKSTPLAVYPALSAVPGEATAKMTVKDLPERAGAAYITALAAKATSIEDFQAAVAKPVSASAPPSSDRTGVSRTLLLTVSPGPFAPDEQRQHPGDRLTYIEMWVQPINFIFTGIPATATTWSSQPIDTTDVSTTTKVDPELDATLLADVKGALKSPFAFDRTKDVKGTNAEPYRPTTINLRGGDIVVEATGARDLDLEGTAIVKTTIAPLQPDDPNNLETVTVASGIDVGHIGKWAKDADAKIVTTTVRQWKPVYLVAKLYLWYGVRHVTDGAGTYAENDDKVQYLDRKANVSCVAVLAPADTVSPTWSLVFPTPLGQTSALVIGTDQGPRQLHFQSLDDAYLVKSWIEAGHLTTLGTRPIGYVDDTAAAKTLVAVPKGATLQPWSATDKVSRAPIDQKTCDAPGTLVGGMPAGPVPPVGPASPAKTP